MVNVARDIEAQLPRELRDLIRAAGELAADKGQNLYLVGGAVRDLFLGRPNLDLDLVLEGDAPSLARELAKLRGGKVLTHPRFGTATISQGTISLDLVTARSETYAKSGALPAVKPGTIQDDLLRRDFTINAMAAHLDPARFGELVDPYGGKGDLDRGLVRVLHQGSFKDDPTRIWRAIRYEQRLGFRLEPDTETLLRRDVVMMDRVSGDRLRHELEHILQEDHPEKAIYRAEELGTLQQLLPSLEGNGWLAERYERARQASPDPRPESVLYLALLAWRLGAEQLKAFIQRLRFGREEARTLLDIPGLKKALPSLEAQELLSSHICRLLERHRPQTILAAALATDSGMVRQQLALYLSNLRFVAPALDGDDLKQMGVPPGKRLGWLLQALKDARLDGKVTTRKGEQELVRQWLIQSER
ncbi:MAG: CCA tRNA nucleotidyltransferase [Dehalococcoidia bacterium]|nr:MAG: CCA tRNA nucleotidyltransferase [Dehalococcoidia bacterium]